MFSGRPCHRFQKNAVALFVSLAVVHSAFAVEPAVEVAKKTTSVKGDTSFAIGERL